MALKKSKAKKSLKKARAGKSKDAAFVKKRLEEAMGLHRQGKLDDAEVIYREVLSSDVTNDEALHLLGVLVSQKGDHEKALELIGQAIKENPQVAQYHDNQGVVNMRLGNSEQAAACHREAIEIDPRYAMAYHNLGVAQDTLMDLSSSLESFKKASSLNPRNADTLDSLGAVLSKLGHDAKALEYHKRALSINPRLARAYGNVAGILNKYGKGDEAFDVYRQQLKLDPQNFDANYALAELSLKHMDSNAALRHVEQALRQKPDDAAAHLKRLEIYSKTMMWDEIDKSLPEFIELVQKQFGSGKLAKAEPFAALPLDVPLDVIRALATERARRIKAEAPALEFTYRKRENQKLRIGYLSADFSSHAVGFLVNDLYALHDKKKFEVYCYSLRRVEDKFRANIKNATDNFIDLDGLSHEEAARRINADGRNILVDLSGYTAHGRPQILALQPAPVQCHAIGYPGTMGADFVQYYITNPACVPKEMQSAFSEKLVYLPETQFAAGAFDIPDIEIKRSDYGLPEDAFVFCCFNHAYRINRKVFESWLEILRQTPQSVLWLKSHGDDMEQRLRAYAVAKGLDAERIIFAKIGLLSERWPQRLADLWLDTFNLSAGTAGFMAAWAGLPSLTLKGPTPQSRTGVNNVLACHLPQMLAENVDEYIEKAVYYASNRDKLQEIKRHLLDKREQLPIFDRQRYIWHLEDAFREMWRIHLEGLKPRDIALDARPL